MLIKGPAGHTYTQRHTHRIEGTKALVPDLSPDQRTVLGSVHVGVKGNLKVLWREEAEGEGWMTHLITAKITAHPAGD